MRLAVLPLALALMTGCTATVGQTRVAFAVGFLADCGTTEIGLKQPGVVESNPVMKTATFTTAIALALVAVVIAEHLHARDKDGAAKLVYGLGAAIHTAAALWNVHVIQQARR